jgi:hypothetical protein
MQNEWPRRAAVFLFAAAVTSGNLKIPGLGDLAAQIRFPLTLACGVAAWFAVYPARPARSSIHAAALVSGLLLFLAVHSALFGAVDIRARYLIDLAHTAVLVWLCVLLIRGASDVETFCISMIAAGVFLIPLWWSVRPPFGPITFYRVEFMAFAAAAFLYLRGWRHMIWLMPVFLFCSLASASKGALLGVPIAVGYGCFMLASIERPWFRLAASGITAVAAFVLLFTSTPEMKRLAKASPLATVAAVTPVAMAHVPAIEPIKGNGTLLSDRVIIGDGSQRLQMALHALKLGMEHPLRGVGVGAFDVVAFSTDPTKPVTLDHYRYPHNISLEVFYSTGLLGLAAFTGVVLLLLVRLHRQIMRDHSVVAIAMGAVFVLFTAHFSGDFYDLRMFWILLVPAWAITDSSKSNCGLHLPGGHRRLSSSHHRRRWF